MYGPFLGHFRFYLIDYTSDATAEAEALTWDISNPELEIFQYKPYFSNEVRKKHFRYTRNLESFGTSVHISHKCFNKYQKNISCKTRDFTLLA